MKTLFKILFVCTALMMLGAMVGGFALLGHDPAGMHIIVNDEEVLLGGGAFGDWLGASLGLFVAGAVCLLVLPLVLLLGVALPLLVVGAAMAVVVLALLGVGTVLGSPLIVLVLVACLALRQRHRQATAATATPSPR